MLFCLGDLKNCSFLYFQYFACHMHENVCPLFWSIHKFSRLLLTISHPDAIKSMAFVLLIIYLFQMQEFQSYIVSHGYSNKLCNYYAKNTNFDPQTARFSKLNREFVFFKMTSQIQIKQDLDLFPNISFTQIIPILGHKYGNFTPQDLMKNLKFLLF